MSDQPTEEDSESFESGNPGEEEERCEQSVKDKVKAFSEYKISDRGLLRLRNDVLEAMCELNRLEANGSKEELVKVLVDWVSVNP